MPGLHVWMYDGDGNGGSAGDAARALAGAVDGGRPDDWRTTVVHASPRLAIALTAYPDYPVEVLRRGDHLVVVDGRLYDGGTTAELLDLAPALLDGPMDAAATAAARWLTALDGDFVAVVADVVRHTAIVLNDRYGRLPLHHASTATGAVVSRDPRVAAALFGRAALDRQAIAHFLLFGHPLGTGTLFAEVARVPPGTLLRLPAMWRTLVALDLEARVAPEAPPHAADDIAAALVGACRARRRAGAADVLSLSGGIDSRLVASAMLRAGSQPIAVTHVDTAGTEVEEAVAAGRVAQVLGIPWQVVPVAPPTGDHVARLLRLKQGANYLGMSRVVPFLDAVGTALGHQIVFFTGDEGDRILGPVAPPVPLDDAASVARYLLSKEAILEPVAVAAATGVSVDALTDDVVARVASYPERTGAFRFAHFMLWERALRWAFEGEDRNRCWFWSVTPFWAAGVFERAAALPESARALHVARVGVLRSLSPELASIIDVSTGARVDSRAFRARQQLRRFARGAAYRLLGRAGEGRLRRMLSTADSGHRQSSPVLALVRAQLEHPAVASYLEPDAVTRILARAGAVPREQFSVLYTVTSLIQAVEQGAAAPALDRFRKMPFV